MSKLRNNEVIRVAELAYKNLSSDLKLFTSFSKSFNADYLDQFKSSIETLRPKIEPSELVQRIIESERKYRSLLAELKAMTIRVEDLCILYKQRIVVPRGRFMLLETRREIRKENIKGINNGCSAIIAAIEKNMPYLEVVGFNQALIDEIKSLTNEFATTKNELDKLRIQQKELFASNQAQILSLQNTISFINKYGKLIFQKEDPTQKDRYSLAYAIDTVRKDEKEMLTAVE